MKVRLLILTFSFVTLTGFLPDTRVNTPGSGSSSGFIDITVLSNLGKQFFGYSLRQQCIYYEDDPSENRIAHIAAASKIIIPVRDFKCVNKFAYNDLLNLLKAEQYPYLEIDLPAGSYIKYEKEDSVLLKGVSFLVAGVTKPLDINCGIDKPGSENQTLIGTTKIRLTDLGITPPVKLFGLLKVDNEIIINFEFCLKFIRS